MLRYKTETRPGLVALYDIWLGNGVGLFLQPWSRSSEFSKTLRVVNKIQQEFITSVEFFFVSLGHFAYVCSSPPYWY